MRCRSVACLWPARDGGAAAHGHRVTASAVLEDPPALYTGGSDGSIIWWHLPRFGPPSPAPDQMEIWPMAVLCGHSAPVVDLVVCLPVIYHLERDSTKKVSSTPTGSGAAMLSACTNGVLCIWSRSSGHCKFRRKLPPQLGIPAKMATLSSSPRYVFIVSNHFQGVNSLTEAELSSQEPSTSYLHDSEALNRESSLGKIHADFSVIIVDSCTLNIVNIVHQGSLADKPAKYMRLVESFSPVEDMRKQVILVGDAVGNVRSVALFLDPDRQDSKDAKVEQEFLLSIETSFEENYMSEHAPCGISISSNGKLLFLVSKTQCIFLSLNMPKITGEILFRESPFYSNELNVEETFFEGGFFLQFDHPDDTSRNGNLFERFSEIILLWCNTGAAVVYILSDYENKFQFDPICQIPPVSCPPNVNMSVRFCYLKNILLRIESQNCASEMQSLLGPHVSAWPLCGPPFSLSDNGQKLQNNARVSNYGKLPSCTRLLEGGFIGNLTCQDTITSTCSGSDNRCTKSKMLKKCSVSSSMVLSEEFGAPSAVIYGFFSGEIEIARFHVLSKELINGNTANGLHHGGSLQPSKLKLLGHTDAILCLAAHSMVVDTSDSLGKKWMLISGSKDSTIRVWDVGSGALVIVLHHHVGPVRQIVLAPPWTSAPWRDCFLSVGEDACVALTSLATMRVERMFPGHPGYPERVVWDSRKGYLACLCQNMMSLCSHLSVSNGGDYTALCIWDVKTGASERILRGAASLSMFEHFCKSVDVNFIDGNMVAGATLASPLALPVVIEDNYLSMDQGLLNSDKSGISFSEKDKMLPVSDSPVLTRTAGTLDTSRSGKNQYKSHLLQTDLNKNDHGLINCFCPIPGIAALMFDLPSGNNKFFLENIVIKDKCDVPNIDHHQSLNESHEGHLHSTVSSDSVLVNESSPVDEHAWVQSSEGFLVCFSLSFLHFWGMSEGLDKLLMDEISIRSQEHFVVVPGLEGNRGSLTILCPSEQAILGLWRCSSEFSAMRSLTMVSLAQRMASLSHTSSAVSSALAAFYTRNFAEVVPDIAPPLLQVLVSFWQDSSDDVRMAARSLFHCAASRAIPRPLRSGSKKVHQELNLSASIIDDGKQKTNDIELKTKKGMMAGSELGEDDKSEIRLWLESFEMKDWISCVGGTNQDAMASHIIVAGALVVWYPSIVKSCLSTVVAQPLVKLVMATNEKYSSTAAELLAEGMESTWKAIIGADIPRLIGDIFFQIECVSVTSSRNSNLAITIKETLMETLLPSLAMADILEFLHVIERQIWATASDSSVHLVSIKTLIRVIRGSSKQLAVHIDKVVNFILETMDPANSVMRKICFSSSMAALREVVRVFPMVSMNEGATRLAVGDAIGDIRSASIQVYDLLSVAKVKVLDASGPPGLPTSLEMTTIISALKFSPDGEGLVAFSEHGLMLRWWSLGTAWWEKLSKTFTPVQCTKLIFIPPWEGFSPSSTRSSVMASITRGNHSNSEDKVHAMGDMDSLKLLINNLDLYYRLEWVSERKILLIRHGHQLGSFQL